MTFASPRKLLSRLPDASRKNADWLAAILVALLMGVAVQMGFFRVPDGIIFDVITTHEPARKPRVILIEQDPAFQRLGDARHAVLARTSMALGAVRIAFMVDPGTAAFATNTASGHIVVGHGAEPVPGRHVWRLTGGAGQTPGLIHAARKVAAPEYGIYRRQLAWLDGADAAVPLLEAAAAGATLPAQSYYVRMPRAQNMPRITASQLINGDLAAGELKGMIALVSPAATGTVYNYATPLSHDGEAMSASEFSAYAIQTLADERAVRPLYEWLSPLIILLVCLAAAALYRRFDPKRIIVPATAGIMLAVFGLTALLLQFANILLPTSALILSQGLVAVLAIQRSETRKDQQLSHQVDRAVSIAFKRGVFDNQARLPEILLGSAKGLGTRHMLLLEKDVDGNLTELGAIGAALEDLSGSPKQRNALFGEARASDQPRDASALLPAWEGPVWVAWLGGAERDIYWFYSLAGLPKRQRGERLANAMIGSYRQLKRLRASLSAGEGRKKTVQAVEARVTSALDLITGHDEQIRNGSDALDTAVIVFHLLGYPLHANARMSELFEDANLSLADATLPEVLAGFTELDPERIAVMLHELLFRGGELRVPCRKLGARALALRIAAPFRVARGNERVIVLEAIDITNLKRLADLRLSVSTYIDTQLRNDLTAIELGVSVASDKRIEGAALRRIIDLIAQAAKRATGRLESVAAFLIDSPEVILELAYPIDASSVARQAIAKVSNYAEGLKVAILSDVPEMGGYSIAEPEALEAMLDAILRIMIAETQPGDSVSLQVAEERSHIRIRLSGGFGVTFASFCEALEEPDAGAPPEYRAIAAGMKQALGWKSSLSYWTDIGKGYRFNIELRRIA
jgi:hypothetical protein